MLQERNQRCRQTYDLVRSDVHVLNLFSFQDREVTCFTGFDFIFSEASFVIQRNVRLCNFFIIFLFRTQVNLVFQVYFTIINFTIRCFDEAHVIDLSMYTQCRDQTDVWTLWSFNGTQTAIVRVVNVTYLKAGSFTGQTTWSECRDTTLVRDLRQRVGLIQELR
ncbi:hypothetical protein D3C86_1223850 [compost metagenome]